MGKRRKTSEADIYHVIARGTGRQIIFEEDGDRSVFLQRLDAALERTKAELLAWCLMSSHVHLLFHADLGQVSKCMQQLCKGYALWFNKKAGRTGHLFQARYKSEPIGADAYLLTVIRYIHDNPEKAGLAPACEYPWSSYAEYAGEEVRSRTSLVVNIFGQDAITHPAAVEGLEHAARTGARKCIGVEELRSKTRAMPDSLAIEIAQEASAVPLNRIKGLQVKERNAQLRRLKKAGLSQQQIERLTGVGHNVVQRA